jgi:phospholipase C
LFEALLDNIVDKVRGKPELFAETAIIVTWDESGGFYDSGFIQPIDFFGDGPRVPLLVISPFFARRPGGPHLLRSRLDHQIHRAQLETEAAQRAQPRQSAEPHRGRGRQSLRAAQHAAIGDLMEMFHFGDHDDRDHDGRDHDG